MECPPEVKSQLIDYVRERAYTDARIIFVKSKLASSEVTAISLFNSAQMIIPSVFNGIKIAWEADEDGKMYPFPLVLEDVLLEDRR